MKIARIHIENYRSIKSLDFTPGAYCALIGENNSGKSNILKAINLLLGDNWPSENAFSFEDFHYGDGSRDIVIQLFFDAPWEERINGYPVVIGGFELRCHLHKAVEYAAASLRTEFCCLGEKGTVLQCPQEPWQPDTPYKGRWQNVKVTNRIRAKVPFVYVDVLADYGKSDPKGRWSVLKKLLDSVNASITAGDEKVSVPLADGRTVQMPRREAFQVKLQEAYQYLRTDELNAIEKSIQKNALEQMGFSTGTGQIKLRFDTHDPMDLYKNLQLFVDQLGLTTAADNVGAGMQSDIVIAILRTYQQIKNQNTIFAIEEPEAFLHPQKARDYSDILNDLANQNQIFLTTHSPIFVRLHEPEKVCLVRRAAASGTSAKICNPHELIDDDRSVLKLHNFFDTQRSELLFARAVILVEGETEEVVFPHAARLAGVSLNRMGISIIECGGKDKILVFIRVARAFSIPFVVVVDDDIHPVDGVRSPKERQRLEWDNDYSKDKNKKFIRLVAKENLFWMRENIEANLGMEQNGKNKPQRIVEFMQEHVRRKGDLPACLTAPIMRAVELASGTAKTQGTE